MFMEHATVYILRNLHNTQNHALSFLKPHAIAKNTCTQICVEIIIIKKQRIKLHQVCIRGDSHSQKYGSWGHPLQLRLAA